MTSAGGELLAVLAALPASVLPLGEDGIVAVEHAGLGCWIGRTKAGCVCVLVPTTGSSPGRHLRLRNIEVRESVHWEVVSPDGPGEAVRGTLVVCRSEQAGMIRLFLGLVADAMATLGPRPAASDLSRWVVKAAELFSRLEKEGRRTMQGLWAELVVVSALPDLEVAVRRWHADPAERYDLTCGSFSIEVKSCADLDRVHHFSLDQLRPQPGAEVWIASVTARPEPLGQSVLDLVNAVEARIPTLEVRTKLRDVVFSSAGSAIYDDDRYRFDEVAARGSLVLMNALSVPSVPGPLPPEVLGVQLRVMCKDVPFAGGLSEAALRLQ